MLNAAALFSLPVVFIHEVIFVLGYGLRIRRAVFPQEI